MVWRIGSCPPLLATIGLLFQCFACDRHGQRQNTEAPMPVSQIRIVSVANHPDAGFPRENRTSDSRSTIGIGVSVEDEDSKKKLQNLLSEIGPFWKPLDGAIALMPLCTIDLQFSDGSAMPIELGYENDAYWRGKRATLSDDQYAFLKSL